jgi:hypothetical protein
LHATAGPTAGPPIYSRELVVGAPAALGDGDPDGDPLFDGDGLAD